MKKLAGINPWLRLTVVMCTTLASVITATSPAFGQQEVAQSPQARTAPKTDDIVEIRAGELPGRVINGEQIDVKGCVQHAISDTVNIHNKSEATLGIQGPIKTGAYLCGDGVAIDKQVIVAGTTKELDKLKEIKAGIAFKSELVKANPEKKEDIAINLYTITDETSVVEKIKTINLYLRERQGINVVATPNYETASKVTSLPSGGSPSIGGSPSGPKGLAQTQADFKNQWVWDAINKPVSSTTNLTGKGVVVGIFDSFCTPAAYLRKEGIVINTARLAAIGLRAKTDPQTHRQVENVCAHGEFVWSLSHEVAPDAQYFFYPVLDESGLGDMATLIAALEQFITTTQRLESRKEFKDLHGVVINLSLNVNSIQGDIVLPLQAEIAKLIKLGAVVVAASGNDSSAGIQPMRLPAAYSDVIGVAAVQKGDQRASYSNWVAVGSIDVAAPGGDGDCRTSAEAPYCVVGKDSSAAMTLCRIVTSRGICLGRYTKVTGYRAWSGTSFATPLVSGLAALVVQKGNYTIPPTDVGREIAANATRVTTSGTAASGDVGIGEGVINVKKTVP